MPDSIAPNDDTLLDVFDVNDSPLSLEDRETRRRIHIMFPENEMAILTKIKLATKARSLTAVIRYAVQTLAILMDSKESKEKGWQLCWVRDGKARRINIVWD